MRHLRPDLLPPETCLTTCRSPVACNGFGYCRQRNIYCLGCDTCHRPGQHRQGAPRLLGDPCAKEAADVQP